MKIKLEEGKEIYLEAYHCTPTYAGLLVGSPTKENNENLIERLSYPSNWGKKVTVLKKTDMYASENILKPIINSAWLSYYSIDNDNYQFEGSCIVAIWFSDEVFNKSLNEIINEGIRGLDWNKYADFFQF